MLPSSLPTVLCAVLLVTAHAVSAAPGAASDVKRLTISLQSPTAPKTTREIRAWARRQAENLRRKYNAVGYEEKRANTASVPLTDANADLQYFGAIQVVRIFLQFLIARHPRAKHVVKFDASLAYFNREPPQSSSM
jgi:hypothetical protein